MKSKRIWDLKQSLNDPSNLDMYIYGDVQGDYFDWYEWQQKESETSANHFRNELNKYPDVKQINIFINSYGGSVFEGTAIYSQLKRHPAEKVIYIDGFACSVASVIAMAGDKVIMPKNTMMMIHNAWNIAAGNAKQLRKAADDLDVIMTGNRQAYLEKSKGKITEEKLIELLDTETWLTAEQCLEYGFADELLTKEVDLTEANQLLQKMNTTLEQQISYNKALSAQAKDFTQKIHEPHKEPTPKEPQENKTIKLMAALFANKER
ncbi:head maturation protease, ClpP-related [Clostridium sp. YIM B02506]|uniref:head maturation protease, ClpP-related n=1 Tax=Clostridium sp. YIM B02506 TaxID=2910680 RepID=UPI001EEE02B0|nr:head maturation protease, ClpP-related [Clostridium sp. YIM B02506]